MALERQVSSFLSKLKQDGAFVGATAEQAYFVRTSAPAALVDAAHDVALTLRVGFAPKRPNEFVTFDFRYHAVQLVTEVVPVHEAERCLG